ncbi:spore germination protein [Mesobacillus maritimus]|uniref:spore germination protein n=1 Tax=Mesobacillus maritimus TaxID=1643336 RepID=UPI00203E37D7|nr:spore germination protein [Mesobacillus maritimus]MCM3587497.1 spore germination protein [Mesobacillus maritimus]MCM3671144.1 spore germination protein [Mesobacillus maritimus]
MPLKGKKQVNVDEAIVGILEELKLTGDVVHKPLRMDDKEIELLYIKTVVDGDQLHQLIIKPFFELGHLHHVASYLNSLPNQQEVQSQEQILLDLTKGSVLVKLNKDLLLFDVKKVNTNTVRETSVEPTILGPQYALSEDLATNINLIRQRYHKPSLTVEMHEVGSKTNQSLAVIYDQNVVKEGVLKEVNSRISELDQDIVQSTTQLQRFMNNRTRSLLPTMMATERTDRIVYNLAGGKVILLVDGSPSTVIAPAVFFDFMTSMEDNYGLYWVTKFSKFLRYLGLFACLILPGLYVAATSFNPEVFRVELALSIAGSRIGVPYPSFVEVLFMLIIMELLTEASIRLPKAVTGTATTVGGLILGTAATEAALASNIMIIIVAAVAISTFVIPINEMSYAIRVIRYILLLFASIAGLAGLALALIGILMYMTNKDSFGEPYFKIYFNQKRAETGDNPS